MPDTQLIDVRGPTAQEAEDGAEIVFHRREAGGLEHFIKASWSDGSYYQWGATTPVLGDNVGAVTAWANGITDLKAMCQDEDDDGEEEGAEAEAEAKGWEVGDRCDVPDEADRGEILEFIGWDEHNFAIAKVRLDMGGEVEVSVNDLDILYDEPDSARPY